jgi:UDP-3-O-[3-hydroxymyristoyl] N-acetylglucosamine deacetylase
LFGEGELFIIRNLQFEQTISGPVEFSGIGLHSGAPVHLRLLPAPAGAGILFRRADLDNFEIPATGRNVAKVSYATSLMRQGVLISTTEHLLSALIGYGIDNLIVELDNLELPILDGSALPFIEAFRVTGVRTQRRRRELLRVRKAVEVRESGKFIGIYPGEGYRVSYAIDFPSPIGKQAFELDLNTGAYALELAPARTFGFREDERMLRDMGLIRGASEENAIILTRQGVQNGPLRFADEFVRHKMLDLIGDLALVGRRIQGHVIAERAGHAMHTALVSRLLRDRSAWELVHVPAEEAPKPRAGSFSPARAVLV